MILCELGGDWGWEGRNEGKERKKNKRGGGET